MARVTLRFVLLLSIFASVAAPAAAQLKATLVVSGLTRPLGFVQDPSDSAVQIILEKDGLAKVLKDGIVQPTPFLNLTDPAVLSSAGEGGLLGLAFAPDYPTSRRVYVSFTNAQGHSVVARFLRDAINPLALDPTSRFDLVWSGGARWIVQPFTNHDGGHLAFGPDGYLYFGLGDGGSFNDPAHRAQNPQTLLGKMLRIDVSVPLADPEGYDIPPTNPFAWHPGVLHEIWAFGLRNPWQFTFDYPRAGSTGALLIADVGQNSWEELNYEPVGAGGRNYGWRNREGAHDNVTSLPALYAPLQNPILEYGRGDGSSITGGFVYRGQALGPAYTGRYFYGDFGSNRVWSMGLTVDPVTGEATGQLPVNHTPELGAGADRPTAFGVDAAGELYVVNYGGFGVPGFGSIHRIERNGPPPAGSCVSADPYTLSGGGLCVQGAWLSRARGSDLNADQRADVLFANTSKQLYAWFMAGANHLGGTFLSPGQIAPTREVVGINDFTGDGKPDLVVQDQVSGAMSIFIMDGTTRTSEQAIPAASATPWRIAATGDFDGDSNADVLWTLPASGQYYVWFMRAVGGQAAFGSASGARDGLLVDASAASIVISAPWRVVGTGDITGDGKADIFLQNEATGALAVRAVVGTLAAAQVSLSPASAPLGWRIRAVADYNGDQHPDLVWEHQATGELYVWFMVERRFARGQYLVPSPVNPDWQITGPK